MPSKTPFTTEKALYVLILVLAGGLRFANLGGVPLSEAEASQALNAMAASQAKTGAQWANLTYVLPTSWLFYFLDSNEFLARFWPALAGSVFVLLPYGWRHSLGKQVALVAALGLALAPGFVAISRTASGEIIGLAALCFALLAWQRGRLLASGALVTLALTSGPNSYVGLVVLLLAWVVATIFRQPVQAPYSREFLSPFATGLLTTIGVLMALALRTPQGLSGAGAGLAAFLFGWSPTGGFPLVHLPLWMLAYAFPPLVFGVAALFLGWRKDRTGPKLLGTTLLAALLFLLLYPGRAAAHILWLELPLWLLASRAFLAALPTEREDWLASSGAAGLILLLAIFVTLRFAGVGNLNIADRLFSPSLVLGLIVLGLGLVATVLIALGWSSRVAAGGLAIGFAVISVTFLLAADTRLLRGEQRANELTSSAALAPQSPLFLQSLNELSIQQDGQAQNLDVVYQSDSAALAWALRDWPGARFDRVLDTSEQPTIIVSSETEGEPQQAASYRGQRFVWNMQKSWGCCGPPNLIGWLLFREAPTMSEDIVLWARQDLFPGGDQSDDLEVGPVDAGAFGAE